MTVYKNPDGSYLIEGSPEEVGEGLKNALLLSAKLQNKVDALERENQELRQRLGLAVELKCEL